MLVTHVALFRVPFTFRNSFELQALVFSPLHLQHFFSASKRWAWSSALYLIHLSTASRLHKVCLFLPNMNIIRTLKIQWLLTTKQ